MSDLLEQFQELQRIAQASMPERPLDDFMVTVSYSENQLRYYFKVKNHETKWYYEFSKYNPNKKIKAHTPQEAIPLMKLAIEQYGMKFTEPDEIKMEKAEKRRAKKEAERQEKMKAKHSRARLPKNRDKKEDFETLVGIFTMDEIPGYSNLLKNVEEWFEMSQRAARQCITYWREQGMIVKEGPDRSPLAYYRLGKLPPA